MGIPLFPDETVLERVRKFNNSLDRLMRLYTEGALSSVEFIGILTEEASLRLQVQRASAWVLDEEQSQIECIDLYETLNGQHSSGAILYASDFPKYFDAVITERVITASDARTDPRTSEFTEVYLKPNRVISMLDTQIRSAGGARGVICLETVDEYREWSPDEAAYAASLAELIGFFMDREDRSEIYDQLQQTNAQLAEAVSKAEQANERFDLALKASFDGIWDHDLTTDRLVSSEQNFELLGITSAEGTAAFTYWQQRVHKDDKDRVIKALNDHIAGKAPYNETYRILHKDGSWRWWRSRAQVVRNEAGEPVRVVGTNSDVTELFSAQLELKQRNQELLAAKMEIEASALHDALTELPNRRYLVKIFDEMLDIAKQKQACLSVLHIDLDYFKDVNDRYGHAMGDAALKRIAGYLMSLTSEEEFVARIGGDEFMAILFDEANAQRAIQFSEKLSHLLSDVLQIDDCVFEIGASVGIAVDKGDQNDVWSLLSDADLALYEAKKSGRKRHMVFEHDMRVRAAFARTTKEDLRIALDQQDQIIPYFQPQFCAKSHEPVGFEVLARWQHPTRGLLMPGDFLGYAAEMDKLTEIDRQILKRAIEYSEAWAYAGFDAKRLSLNVSSDRLVDPDLLECVEELGERTSLLSFELLESTFLDDTNEEVKKVLKRLHQLNVEIEIDDFGSGYASILSLVNVRPARLKIDASLTRDVGKDPAMHSLIASIVNIARALDISVVAEGVENPSQSKKLTNLGCDILQGYGLGMPMRGDDVLDRFGPEIEQHTRRIARRA